jgi:protein ImuB
LQRIRRQRPDLRAKPLTITRLIAGKGGKVITCCERAQRGGVRPGMMVAEALATLPGLTGIEEDLDADRLMLTELAEWAQRYSPIVGLEDAVAPTCLFIDISGCASCFGGEDALVRKACAEFKQNGWTVLIALADTIGAAWAACGFALAGRHASAKPQAALPVAALRLSAATLALLAQLGIERIGQLMALPRDEVAQRFGAEVGLRLDQMTGRVAEVIAPLHPAPDAAASWAFDDPVERRDIIVKVLDILLERLQAILKKRLMGTRLVECVFELDGADTLRFECSLSRAAQTASYLRPLLHLKLEQVRVDAPIRAMSVRAVVLDRMADEQPNLFDVGNDAALAQLLDSLTSRLGKDAVTMPRFVADPQPELACDYAACSLALARNDPSYEGMGDHRPLRLFPRPTAIEAIFLPFPLRGRGAGSEGAPQRLRIAGADHAVVLWRGPERIETGWWRGDDVQRDYYLVETADGTRWWIFQRLNDGRWFLHGCFD